MKNQKHLVDDTAVPVPYSLKKTQEWFASVITGRLGKNYSIQKYSNDKLLMADEASRYITASASLKPHQRMQIYNQQYWWRLFNTLHANFPLVTRLFGYHAFNEKIAIPYILKYPPNHWSLIMLGEHLPQWIVECYREPDQSLISHAAQLDWAFTSSFIAAQKPFLNLYQMDQAEIEKMISSSLLYLQPHIHLFSWEYHLFAFREEFLKKGVDYWTEHRFPELRKGKAYHFILYRTVNNQIAWAEIDLAAFILLERFKIGTTIEAACTYLETQESPIYEQATLHLQNWLQEWMAAGWLTSIQR